ncbi:MAG TPA: TIGR03435 family protein [Bryobacteraceae bacterium]|jgi:uncharacterized protein (TIGR03435 family)
MRLFRAVLVATVCVAALLAQNFETASVKRSSQKGGADLIPPQQDPTRINYPGVTLRSLLAQAYGIALEQITGPKWIGEERFDIDAKLPAGATPEQIRVMLQHLLAQRFGVVVHEENKTAKFFALVPAKGGVKMKAVEKPEISATVDLVSDSIQLRDYTMPQFAAFLSKSMGHSVVDETGLTGAYDITLYLTMSDIKTARIRIAIHQLGLQFEDRTGTMKSLVVDSANKIPTQD